jgi:hypothetical protein
MAPLSQGVLEGHTQPIGYEAGLFEGDLVDDL